MHMPRLFCVSGNTHCNRGHLLDILRVAAAQVCITCWCMTNSHMLVVVPQVRVLDLHSACVNDISFDTQEEHLATCSSDFSAAVSPMGTVLQDRGRFGV